MKIKLINSLKFQVTAVMIVLLSLFSYAISYTLYAIEEREKETAALQLINRLQWITHYVEMQNVNYLQSTQMIQQTNDSELKLFYKDLIGQLDNKNDIISCFADEHLRSDLVGMNDGINLNLDKKTKQTLINLQKSWNDYFVELKQTLGETESHKKLLAAANYIANHQDHIKEIENVVVNQLQNDISKRIEWINYVNKMVLIAAFCIVFITLIGFYLKVIKPLNKAVEGFNTVSRGDFGHQVIINTRNEVASIAESFNHLSQRLHSIFKLIDKVQQGSDLDTTMGFIAEHFTSILPINWTSVLLHNGNATMLELQKTYMDSKPYALPRTLFSIEGTLLEKAINSDRPLLISKLDEVAKKHSHYVFLNLLAKEGMKSAIFLHLTQTTKIPGILVFASREPDAYSEEHIELLSNIAHLVTHSFGKTVRMAEQKRLAAIGEFTSGIVHEVRNPLTTLILAIKYFSKLPLDEDGQEWSEIANRESERMKRLLDDVLLYAKPVQLDLSTINLNQFITDFLSTQQFMIEQKQLTLAPFEIKNDNEVFHLKADPDRLKQVFFNIYKNAVEAADNKSTIRCLLEANKAAHTVTITVNNQGDVIPPEFIHRIGEPFFTTKSRGTGLGMGIVKRMIESHSGNLVIHSNEQEGTSVVITLPLLGESSYDRISAE